MKRHTALAVLLVAALPGSLLIGCSSDNADNADTSTPPANPLVGTWLTEGPISNPQSTERVVDLCAERS